jgi:hypothetical protein
MPPVSNLGHEEPQKLERVGISAKTLRKWAENGFTNRDLQISPIADFDEQQLQGGHRVRHFAAKWGVSYACAALNLRNGTIPKKFRKKEKKPNRHNLYPSTHAVWYLAELAREIKSFPDWGCLWDEEQSKKRESSQRAEKWKQTPREKRDEINARIRASRATDEARAKRREYKRARIEADPSLKIQGALRTRLRKFIRGNNKSGIRNLLGCSWLQFRRHLEAQFTRGIAWENYGPHWHVDHIIPCAAFDHTKPEQVRQCWHFTTLRPLEAKVNLAKGAKIEAPQLSLLLAI